MMPRTAVFGPSSVVENARPVVGIQTPAPANDIDKVKCHIGVYPMCAPRLISFSNSTLSSSATLGVSPMCAPRLISFSNSSKRASPPVTSSKPSSTKVQFDFPRRHHREDSSHRALGSARDLLLWQQTPPLQTVIGRLRTLLTCPQESTGTRPGASTSEAGAHIAVSSEKGGGDGNQPEPSPLIRLGEAMILEFTDERMGDAIRRKAGGEARGT
jgi:hypothetical protein